MCKTLLRIALFFEAGTRQPHYIAICQSKSQNTVYNKTYLHKTLKAVDSESDLSCHLVELTHKAKNNLNNIVPKLSSYTLHPDVPSKWIRARQRWKRRMACCREACRMGWGRATSTPTPSSLHWPARCVSRKSSSARSTASWASLLLFHWLI